MKFLGKHSCMGIGCVAAGFLAGTVGKLILTSKDAKKVYTYCTAAVLRGKDTLMETTTTLKENCEDIYEDAMDINAVLYAEEEMMMVERARAIVEAYDEDKEAVEKQVEEIKDAE
ncbi:DUF6110 family protein [Mogibacterium pumilum]|nr:DUF6110 family protein [Mogibacterium pumilum]